MKYSNQELFQILLHDMRYHKEWKKLGIIKIETDYLHGQINQRSSSPESNHIRETRLTKQNVDQKIEETKNIFKKHGKSCFSWLILPNSEPVNLKQKLIEHKFTHFKTTIGMAKHTKENLNIQYNPKFEYKEITLDDLKSKKYQKIFVEGYGGPKEMMDSIIQSFKLTDNVYKRKIYAVRHKIENIPIALGIMKYIPNTKVVLLSGSATLPEYRNQGAYSGLLKKRYKQCKNDGISYLITNARKRNSVPILKKYGFYQFASIKFYLWCE